nr:MAG TPA: hypothetical protein [Caudoviricetes sp.]
MTWMQQSLHKPRLERLAVALASAMPQHGVASHYNMYVNPSIDWMADQYQTRRTGVQLAVGKGVTFSYGGQALIPAFRMPEVSMLGVFAAGVRATALISSCHPKPIVFGSACRIAQGANEDVVMFNDDGNNYTWWRRSTIDASTQSRGDTTRRFMAGLQQTTQCLAIDDTESGLLSIDDELTNVIAISEVVGYHFVNVRHDMAGLATIKDAIK